MNDGWVRGWILGGGQGPTEGDTNVTMNAGLIGPPLAATETVGQAEIYGGGINADGTVEGTTHVTVNGAVYDESTYQPGDKVTLVRQHVLGGGSSGAVVTGNTNVDINGGTIMGMVLGGPGGGGVANSVIGDTNVRVNGGVLTTLAGSTRGGSVFGGGYAAQQNVVGNTNVHIGPGATILGGVHGGGYAGPYGIQGNTVSGNATTVVEGGHIGQNILAGGYGLSRVNGVSTVYLRGIEPGDPFASDFTRNVLRGGIGTGGTARTIFDSYTAPFEGKVGATGSGQMDAIEFIAGSHLVVDPADYFGRNWAIAGDSTVDVSAPGTMSSVTFTNAGSLRLNSESSPENLSSTIGADYLTGSGTLSMSATDDTTKNFLSINGAGRLGASGTPSTIDLDLDPGWDGTRIDLVRSAEPGDADTFGMAPIPINNGSFRGTAVLKSETNESGGTTWYIEGEVELPYTVIVNQGTLPGGLPTADYFAGDDVTVTARAPASGERFDHWTVDSGGPLPGFDPTSSSTTFTMPANDVEVTAHFVTEPEPSPPPSTPAGPTSPPSRPTGQHPVPPPGTDEAGLAGTGMSLALPLGLAVGTLALGGSLLMGQRMVRRWRRTR